MTKVSTETIDGVKFDLTVNPENGKFYAVVDAKTFDGTTRRAVLDKVRTHIRTSTKLAIPATNINAPSWYERADMTETPFDRTRFEDVELIGMQTRGRRHGDYPVTRDENGHAEMHYGKLYRRLTDDERKKVVSMYKAKCNAEFAYEEYLTTLEIDPREAVANAQANILAEVTDPESDE